MDFAVPVEYTEMEEEKTGDDFELLTEDEIAALDVEELEAADEAPSPLAEIAGRLGDGDVRSSVPMYLRLTRRGVVFLSLMLAADLLLFVVGNSQRFLDESLRLILVISTVNAIMLAFLSLAAVAESLVSIIVRRRLRYFLYAVAFVVPAAFACAAGIATRALLMLTEGFPR